MNKVTLYIFYRSPRLSGDNLKKSKIKLLLFTMTYILFRPITRPLSLEKNYNSIKV